MQSLDPATGRARGWMLLRPRSRGIALGFSLKCDGESWEGLARRLRSMRAELGPAADVAALARAIAPLTIQVELRSPGAAAHHEALVSARAALRSAPIYTQVVDAIGEQQAEVATLLRLASVDLLSPEQRLAIAVPTALLAGDSPLAHELTSLRAQLAALLAHT